jgi:hypothetical protein
MGSRFVTIDRDDFCSALEAKGFKQDPTAQGELVYVFQHKLDPTMYVKIYTSLPRQRGDTRGCGKDAIRVLLIFKNDRTQKSGCLFKATRVFRTGTQQGVIERTLERAREAYQVGIDRIKR